MRRSSTTVLDDSKHTGQILHFSFSFQHGDYAGLCRWYGDHIQLKLWGVRYYITYPWIRQVWSIRNVLLVPEWRLQQVHGFNSRVTRVCDDDLNNNIGCPKLVTPAVTVFCECHRIELIDKMIRWSLWILYGLREKILLIDWFYTSIHIWRLLWM